MTRWTTKRKVRIEVGRRLRLRNGATIIVLGRVDRWTAHLTRKRWLTFWVAKFEGTNQRTTFQTDGFYAPECGVRPHELDVVGLAR